MAEICICLLRVFMWTLLQPLGESKTTKTPTSMLSAMPQKLLEFENKKFRLKNHKEIARKLFLFFFFQQKWINNNNIFKFRNEMKSEFLFPKFTHVSALVLFPFACANHLLIVGEIRNKLFFHSVFRLIQNYLYGKEKKNNI